MGGTNLTVTSEERDLGALINDKLSFRNHIKGIVSKDNRILKLKKIGFDFLDKDVFLNLYLVQIRPHLKYCA